MSSVKRAKKFGNTVEHGQNFRVAVFGNAGVGKTAFIVRFITEKFIGDYDPNLEIIYQRLLVLIPNSDVVFFEVVDTLDQEEDHEVLKEKIKWADGFVLLYSVTDRESFNNLFRLKFFIWHTINNNMCCDEVNQDLPFVIVGNKNDLEADRVVTTDEGIKLAFDLKVPYFELSVRESVDDVIQAFTQLYHLHKVILKSGTGRRRSGYGPHIHLPMMPHHLPLLSNLHKHRTLKHVEKMRRMQGLVKNEDATVKRVSETEDKVKKNFSLSLNFSKDSAQDLRQEEEEKGEELHIVDLFNNKRLSQGVSAEISANEGEGSSYDNSSSEDFCCKNEIKNESASNLHSEKTTKHFTKIRTH